MSDTYTADVMKRAAELAELEEAAWVLAASRSRWDMRPALAAALAALLTLLPTVSAAMIL